jgi:hypothetical protein
VVVLDSGVLLTQGVAARLRQEGLDVAVVTPGGDDDLAASLRSLRPQAVVVDSSQIDPAGLIARIFADCPGIAVVGLNLRSPNVEVLHRQLLKAPTIRGLVASISGAPCPGDR